MSESLFCAKDLSVNAQAFLYACAFWTVAADENLGSNEQQWLVEQFGEDGATQSLEDFVALESSEFFQAFDTAARDLTDAEKETIYPHLEAWLLSCAMAEGRSAEEERAIIGKIAERISLDVELARLAEPVQQQVPSVPAPASQPDVLEGHESEVTVLQFSRDGGQLLSASEDATLRLWTVDGSGGSTVFAGHRMAVMAAALCADDRHVVSGDRLGELRLWCVADQAVVWSHHERGHGGITGLSVSPDGALVAVSSDIGLITLVDMRTGSSTRTFSEKRYGAVHDVCFMPDGVHVVSGGDDHHVRIWDVATGKEVSVLSGHEDGIMAVAISPNGSEIASASRDNTVRLWDAASGAVLHVLKGHAFTIHDVAFSEDGARVASAAWDHWLRVWDVTSGRELLNAEDADARFCSVAFHPGGATLVAGDSAARIRIFDLTEL